MMAAEAVFITGGSGGIGRATVLHALECGWDVAFTYRSAADSALGFAEDAAQRFPGQRCIPIGLDLADRSAIEDVCDTVIETLPQIRAVVCNAGIDRPGNLAFMDDEDWLAVLDCNLTGHFCVIRSFLPTFIAQGAGCFVTVSSLAQDGSSGQAAYAASKGGLCALAKTVAKEYGARGIRSNVVLPGAIGTAMIGEDPKGLMQFFNTYGPERRLGAPEEVAQAIMHLCSDRAGYINGAVLPVTGGIDWVY